MIKDEYFKEKIKQVSDFKFSASVANVFDDMVSRSVPFYGEIQRMIAEIATTHVKPDTLVYDLGCSTGTTMISMDTSVPKNIKFVGIDDARDMLGRCDAKLQEVGFTRPYELKVADLNGAVDVPNASVVILCLTLQFVRPLHREDLLKSIYRGLKPEGVLLLVEKVLTEERAFNRNFIDYYYNFKRRNHYSELEIAQKREALENVLVPFTLSENMKMLNRAGFDHHEVFFKWFNFSGIIAQKKSHD
jgi:tRNA (cmo5U34)-methyltransferase